MLEIKLINTDKVALIDDEDYDKIIAHNLNWYFMDYAYTKSNILSRTVEIKEKWNHTRKTIRMHQVILDNYTLYKQEKICTDHINGNKLDNRKENLRLVSYTINRINTRKNKGSSSLYKGVYWSKEKQVWTVQIYFKGRLHYYGAFLSEQEAGLLANKKYKLLYGKEAPVNIIPE